MRAVCSTFYFECFIRSTQKRLLTNLAHEASMLVIFFDSLANCKSIKFKLMKTPTATVLVVQPSQETLYWDS